MHTLHMATLKCIPMQISLKFLFNVYVIIIVLYLLNFPPNFAVAALLHAAADLTYNSTVITMNINPETFNYYLFVVPKKKFFVI